MKRLSRFRKSFSLACAEIAIPVATRLPTHARVMKLDKVQRRFEGGRGPKYVAKTEVPSGRAVPAPRIPPPAAAACRRAMDAFSSSLGMDWGPMLHIAFTTDRTWVRLLAAMRNEGTTVQYEQAAATLRHNRGRYCFANES